MPKRIVQFLVAAGLLASPLAVRAADSPLALDPAGESLHLDVSRYMFEDQIKPGMKGYGLTVMHGGKIERFDVEVIDVMKNFAPNQNAILVRCTGLGLEHSGIIAGMSGSPVFIDDKMIGAVAFGWGMSKDPIGGVQPIRQMLDIPIPAVVPGNNGEVRINAGGGGHWASADTFWSRKAAGLAGWGKISSRLLVNHGPQEYLPATAQSNLHTTQSLRPLASPLMVSSTTPEVLRQLQEVFAGSGLVPLASGGAGATAGPDGGEQIGGAADIKPGEIKLEPGSAIAVPLMSGDMDMSVIGTVTEVQGNRLWAFGHAFLADGPSGLPISTGYIYTILPNLDQSFKMGSSFVPQGMLVTDEQTGVVGAIGKKPAMVPVEIQVQSTNGELNKTYHYQIFPHPRLAAEITGAALAQSLQAQRGMPREFTIHLTGQYKFGAAETVKIDQFATNSGFNPVESLLPIAMLTDNPFEDLPLQGMALKATIEPVNHSAEITSVTLERGVVAPGENILAKVELTPFQGPRRTLEIPIAIPANTPDGNYQVAVGSADMMTQNEVQYFPQRFAPEDIASLEHDIKHLLAYQQDRIYGRLILDMHGVAEHNQELKNLPMSRVLMVAKNAPSDAYPMYNASENSLPAGAIIESGGQELTITVDHDADRLFPNPQQPGIMGPGTQPPANTQNNNGPLGNPQNGPPTTPAPGG